MEFVGSLLKIVGSVRRGNAKSPELEVKASMIATTSCRNILRNLPEDPEKIGEFAETHINTWKWLTGTIQENANWQDFITGHLLLNLGAINR